MRRIAAIFLCIGLCISLHGFTGCSHRAEDAAFVGWFFTAGWIGDVSFSGVDWEGTDITLSEADITLPAEMQTDEATGDVRYRFGGYPGISFFLLDPDAEAGYVCGTSVFEPEIVRADGATTLCGTLRQTDGSTALLYANEVFCNTDGSLFVRPASEPEPLTVGRVLSKTVPAGADGQAGSVTVTVRIAALPES